MVVTEAEIERAYRNDMSLRTRLTADEWRKYLHYAKLLARYSSRWATDLMSSICVIDARVQILQQMLRDGHDIEGVDMFALLRTYQGHLVWAREHLGRPITPELQEEIGAFEDAFMSETLRPDLYRRFLQLDLRCQDAIRIDPKIFVPGIAGFGRK